MGKYGGATVDGHERTDKETGVFAMYGMNSLYALTGEKKYLDAAGAGGCLCGIVDDGLRL